MRILLIICLGFFSHCSYAEQSFNSGRTKNALLELYTSQGCSSCPPADRWMSRLVNHPQLWTSIIPVVFHVDYWNYLGWRDPFSKSSFSLRQREYSARHSLKSVYTPAILFNGKEWRDWYKSTDIPATTESSGMLKSVLVDNELSVTFEQHSPFMLYVALLAFNTTTEIDSGENSGKTLEGNFVVLDLQSAYSDTANWKLKIRKDTFNKQYKLALAIWISSTSSLQPVQSTGGWLE